MIPRDHQDMRWRLDLSGRDPAEQAVWHTTIIVAAGRARRRTARSSPATFPADYPKFARS
jgi:hypothetical protein